MNPAAASTATVERKGRSLSALTIDRRRRRADVAGEALYLSEREFELLLALVDAPERVVTYEELECNAFPAAPGMSRRVIDSHAARLRRKLELRGIQGLVVPCQGIGFCFLEHPGANATEASARPKVGELEAAMAGGAR